MMSMKGRRKSDAGRWGSTVTPLEDWLNKSWQLNLHPSLAVQLKRSSSHSPPPATQPTWRCAGLNDRQSFSEDTPPMEPFPRPYCSCPRPPTPPTSDAPSRTVENFLVLLPHDTHTSVDRGLRELGLSRYSS